MDTLKDFYDFYRPLQRKYDLQMIYKTNSKEAKINIRWRGKEIVKTGGECGNCIEAGGCLKRSDCPNMSKGKIKAGGRDER